MGLVFVVHSEINLLNKGENLKSSFSAKVTGEGRMKYFCLFMF